MTELLEKAFVEATKLSSDEQDALARWLLDELEAERRWNVAFANSADVLSQLADDALVDYREGNTEELNPDNL